MNIAICDDIPAQLDLLNTAISECPVLDGEILSVDRFYSGCELLRTVHSGKVYEFIFLDIQMPESSGLDLYKELANNNTAIIFVSTHIELLPETHALHAPGFLSKPYTQDTFNRTVKSVLNQRAERRFFTYSYKGGENTIPCGNIYYFSVSGHYLFVHTVNGKKDVIYGLRLTDVEKQLADSGFFRCNKAFLVNLRYCDDRHDNVVVFASSNVESKVTISRRKLREYDTQCLIYKWR